MKKVISVSLSESVFILKVDTVEITKFPKSTLILNGKDIFDNLVKTMDRKTKFDFELVSDGTITDSEDKRVFNDLKTIFSTIALKINTTLNLLTEDIDSFLEETPHL